MAKPKKSKLPLFDIRVHAIDKDTILLKGPPSTASPSMLSGVIALSVTEPFQIRKIKLKLYATLSFHWDEKYHNNKGQIFSHPYKFTKMIYCFDWDPINLDKFLHTHNPLQSSFLMSRNPSINSLDNLNNNVGFTTGTLISSNPGSASNLQRIGSSTTINSRGSSTSVHAQQTQSQPQTNLHSRTKSSSSLSTMNITSLTSFGGVNGSSGGSGGTTSNDYTTLDPGNYEFPFQIILDGSIPESIVDHPCCSLVYRLQCSIERGRFTTPIYTKKLLHVIRTPAPDNSELSETIAVDNTWPEKIDYSISVPTKAIAIGSTCQVYLDMSPLCKGLRLGSIKIKLVEFSSFSTATGHHNDERTLTTKHIPKITHNSNGIDIWSDDAPIDEDGVFYRSHNITLSHDKWDVKTTIQLPPSLERMTQDLDISNLCKIRHKLKFSVGLINPDGHVSELRATLPITLFISPFVPIKVKTIDGYDDPFQHSTIDDITIHTSDENTIFKHENVNSSALYGSLHENTVTREENSVPAANMNTQELMAPPNYDDRIYDRVYDLNSERDPLNADTPSSPTPASASNTIVNTVTSTSPSRISTPIPEAPANIDDTISLEGEESDSGDVTMNSGSLDPFATTPLDTKANKYLRKYKKPIFSIAGDEEEDDSDILDPFNIVEPPQNHSSSGNSTHPDTNIISGPRFESGERMTISRFPSSNYLMSPGTMSPVQHLSRATSFIGSAGDHQLSSLALSSLGNSSNYNGSVLDNKTLKEMSNPPSYEVAIHSNASMKDLTPVYDNPKHSNNDLRSNLHILDSRLKNLRLSQQSQSLPSSITSKSMTALNNNNQHHPVKRQYGLLNNSTSNVPPPSTPPGISRNISSNSLFSRRSVKLFSNGLFDDHNRSTVRFELDSPGNQSIISTPGLQTDGYFPLQDSNSHASNTSNGHGMITPPKAAHFST